MSGAPKKEKMVKSSRDTFFLVSEGNDIFCFFFDFPRNLHNWIGLMLFGDVFSFFMQGEHFECSDS